MLRTLLVSIFYAMTSAVMFGCYNDHDPNLPPDDVVFTDPVAGDVCQQACAHLAPCPEGKQQEGGDTCVDTCHNNQDIIPAQCVAKARSLSEVKACGIRCK